MELKKHSEEYKTLYDTLRYSFTKVKDDLLTTRYKIQNNNTRGIKNNTEEDLDMYEAFVMCLYLTGGRISEVLDIKLCDIIFNDKQDWLEIIVPTKKTRNKEEPFRSIPINMLDKDYHFAVKPLAKWVNIITDKYNNDQKGSITDNTKIFPFTRYKGYLVCKVCGFNPHFMRKIRLTQLNNIHNLSLTKLKKFSGHRTYNGLIPYIAIGTEDLKKDLRVIIENK